MRVALLGSGYGTNAEALLRAGQRGALNSAEIVGIISDNSTARILELGNSFNIPALYLDPGHFRTKLTPEAEQVYISTLNTWGVDLVVLAGFMRVLEAHFLKAFEGKIINLHPSLLPAFPGLDAIKQAWDSRARVTGCTVHWVNEEIDGGQIIAQTPVPIEQGDTLESLRNKVHAAEHELLPSIIALLAKNA